MARNVSLLFLLLFASLFGRWGIKGYAASGSEGAYAKDEVTDVRPEGEKAGVKLNTREVLVVRFPEMEAGGDHDENGASDGTPMGLRRAWPIMGGSSARKLPLPPMGFL